jgi:hypothetical protein
MPRSRRIERKEAQMTFTIDKVNPGVLPAEVALWIRKRKTS